MIKGVVAGSAYNLHIIHGVYAVLAEPAVIGGW